MENNKLQEEYNNACLFQGIIKNKGEVEFYMNTTEDKELKEIYNKARKSYTELAKELGQYILDNLKD